MRGFVALGFAVAACAQPAASPRRVEPDASAARDAAPEAAAEIPEAGAPIATVAPAAAPEDRALRTLASGFDRIDAIALDESDAYVLARAASAWRLWRVPKRGGAAARIDDFHADSIGIAVDDGYYYVATAALISEAIQGGAFRTSVYGRVVGVSKVGGARVTIFDGLRGAFFGVVSDGANVYWPSGVVDGVGGVTYDGVMKGSASPARAAFFAMKQGGVRSVAVDASGVYWTLTGRFDERARAWPNGSVVRAPVTGGAETKLATTGAEPRAIALDDAAVYWIEKDGALVRLPKAGGAHAVFAEHVDRFALDPARVCWSSGAAVLSKPKGGGDGTSVDAGAPVTALAVDAAFVYVGVAGELRRAPK